MRTPLTLFFVSLTFIACDSAPPATPPSAKAAVAAVPASLPSGSVNFVSPPDGAKIFTDSELVFEVQGMRVQPAGEPASLNTSGHFHIIIDGEPTAAGAIVPADATHIHYGKGQTRTPLTLAPGKHSLTLQFADGAHVSYGATWSKTIQVEAVAIPAHVGVSFDAPKDGATLHGETTVKFHVNGMTLVPAGDNLLDKTSGHHHLIIDGGPVAPGSVVPADATHLHFGKAQTETKVKLAPGKHSLTLQFADSAHVSYGPVMSATIHVEVK